jgi:nucleotide-binding universal stress UspA family protein
MAETDATAPTLVIGHSRDPSSDFALVTAVDLARRLGGHLHVVHVIEIDDYPVDSDAVDWEQRGAAAVAEQRRRVESRLRDAGVPWTYEDRRGDPARELAEAATERHALMIVLGTRGEGVRQALSRLLEPSVSHGVIHRQHRPVLAKLGPTKSVRTSQVWPSRADPGGAYSAGCSLHSATTAHLTCINALRVMVNISRRSEWRRSAALTAGPCVSLLENRKPTTAWLVGLGRSPVSTTGLDHEDL